MDSVDMSLSKLWEIVKDSEGWRAAVQGVTRVGHNFATEQQRPILQMRSLRLREVTWLNAGEGDRNSPPVLGNLSWMLYHLWATKTTMLEALLLWPHFISEQPTYFLNLFFSESEKWSRSVVSDSLQVHGLQPTRLLSPWNSPSKSTGVGCHVTLITAVQESDSVIIYICSFSYSFPL